MASLLGLSDVVSSSNATPTTFKGAVSEQMAVENNDCCGLGSRVGTRPTPTKTPEIKGDSVGASHVGARPKTTNVLAQTEDSPIGVGE
jgi:hypothetical protein